MFAVLQVSSKTGDANYFNYFSNPVFASASDFDAYIGEVQARSMFQIPVDVEPDDALLKNAEVFNDLMENMPKYDKVWTEVKVAQ